MNDKEKRALKAMGPCNEGFSCVSAYPSGDKIVNECIGRLCSVWSRDKEPEIEARMYVTIKAFLETSKSFHDWHNNEWAHARIATIEDLINRIEYRNKAKERQLNECI